MISTVGYDIPPPLKERGTNICNNFDLSATSLSTLPFPFSVYLPVCEFSIFSFFTNSYAFFKRIGALASPVNGIDDSTSHILIPRNYPHVTGVG